MFRMTMNFPEPTNNCPVLVYLIWSNGRHSTIWVDCRRWRCVKCGTEKLQQIALHITDATLNTETLYQATTTKELHEPIRKGLQRKKLPSLKIRFHDGSYYILTDAALSGRGWSLDQVAKLDALKHIMTQIKHNHVHRRDYTLHWRPEEQFENDSVKAIYRLHVSSLNDAHSMLAELNQSLADEFIENPYDIAERLRSKFG